LRHFWKPWFLSSQPRPRGRLWSRLDRPRREPGSKPIIPVGGRLGRPDHPPPRRRLHQRAGLGPFPGGGLPPPREPGIELRQPPFGEFDPSIPRIQSGLDPMSRHRNRNSASTREWSRPANAAVGRRREPWWRLGSLVAGRTAG